MQNDRASILEQAELFRDLDNEVIGLLASRSVERRLLRDEILFVAGEPAAGLYVVAEGSVRAFRSDLDGREQVIHVERAVTTIAEVTVFDEGNYPSTVAAEEPSLVFFIPRAQIRSACFTHPELALAAAKLLAMRLRKCAELVESLSLREVGQRIANLFLKEAVGRENADGVLVFQQKLTHNQLAARIGTVREVVTRALFKLQSMGLVAIDGRNVTIPDSGALRRYADG